MAAVYPRFSGAEPLEKAAAAGPRARCRKPGVTRLCYLDG
mgnify:CR=1 FL=1